MASPQKVLDMIRNAPNPEVTVYLEVDTGGGYSWISAYGGTNIFNGNVTITGTGDDLIIAPATGNIEITSSVSQAGTINVRGIRVYGESIPNEIYFPETTFTVIDVEFGSTLRFTEIKLTLT